MRVELEKARNLRSRLEAGHSCVGAQALRLRRQVASFSVICDAWTIS
jgi:hypothetical protein